MKKILLSLAVAFSAVASQAQLVPNGDFEDQLTGGSLPKWSLLSVGNILTPTSVTVNGNTLASNGGARFLLAGNTNTRSILMTQKFALGSRPNSLRMQAVYLPNGNDIFTIWIYMTKDTGAVNQPDTIMAGSVSFSGQRYPWQDLRVNLAPAYKNSSVPDSAVLVISAGVLQNSTLLLDDLKFSSWATSITGVENHFHGNIDVFPNPVTDNVTSIRYQLNSESNVKIEVYDMQGKLVKSVFDGKEIYGTYEKEINMEGLSSGMYNCRVVADDQVNVIKLIKQ